MNSFVYAMSALNNFLSQANIFEQPEIEFKFSNREDMQDFYAHLQHSFEDSLKYSTESKDNLTVYGFKINLTTTKITFSGVDMKRGKYQQIWKGNEKILCTVPSKSILKAVYSDHMEFEQVLEDEPTNNLGDKNGA